MGEWAALVMGWHLNVRAGVWSVESVSCIEVSFVSRY